MHFIYATGQPRNMEFAVATTAAAVPADAVVLATFNRHHEEEYLDEQTFAAMTDAEFYTFRALTSIAQRLETQSARITQSLSPLPAATFGSRFMQLLAG